VPRITEAVYSFFDLLLSTYWGIFFSDLLVLNILSRRASVNYSRRGECTWNPFNWCYRYSVSGTHFKRYIAWFGGLRTTFLPLGFNEKVSDEPLQ